MNKIFDGLRESFRKRLNFYESRFEEMESNDKEATEDWGSIKSYKDAIDIVNEAEAKWEAEEKEKPFTVGIDVHKQVMWERDTAIEQLHELGYELGEKPREAECCEWEKVNDTYKNTCGKTTYTHWCSCIRFFKYCPYCGKPIKISEVE